MIIKIFIFTTMFLALFAFQFFHVNYMLKKDEFKKSKKFKICAAIIYPIIDILIILVFIFSFQENTFFSWNKMVIMADLISAVIFADYAFFRPENNSPLKEIIIGGICIILLSTIIIVSPRILTNDFSIVLDNSVAETKFTNVTSISEFKNYYIINYKDKNQFDKQKVINAETSKIVYEDKICVYQSSVIYTKIDLEKKSPQEYTEVKEQNIIYCPKGYITNINN